MSTVARLWCPCRTGTGSDLHPSLPRISHGMHTSPEHLFCAQDAVATQMGDIGLLPSLASQGSRVPVAELSQRWQLLVYSTLSQYLKFLGRFSGSLGWRPPRHTLKCLTTFDQLVYKAYCGDQQGFQRPSPNCKCGNRHLWRSRVDAN